MTTIEWHLFFSILYGLGCVSLAWLLLWPTIKWVYNVTRVFLNGVFRSKREPLPHVTVPVPLPNNTYYQTVRFVPFGTSATTTSLPVLNANGMYTFTYTTNTTIAGTLNASRGNVTPAPLATPETVEDVDTQLVGYRTYSLYADLIDGLVLNGSRRPWKDKRFEAECDQGTLHEHLYDPTRSKYDHGVGTGCGVYSTKVPPRPVGGGVVARVQNWGLVHEGPDGYRAEVCVMEALWIVLPASMRPEPRLVMMLEMQYGVPVYPTTEAEWGILVDKLALAKGT